MPSSEDVSAFPTPEMGRSPPKLSKAHPARRLPPQQLGVNTPGSSQASSGISLIGGAGYKASATNVLSIPSSGNSPPPSPRLGAEASLVQPLRSASQPSSNVVGYAADGLVDGTGRVNDIISSVVTSYDWRVPDFNNITEDKLVSLPFGHGPDWRFQLVLFPRGSSGSGNSHVSCFLRPLRNQDEIDAGEEWKRPLTYFTIQIHRAVPLVGANAVAPDDPMANEDPYILAQETSAQNFTQFDAVYSGWGFVYLLDNSRVPEAINADGSLLMTATISAHPPAPFVTYTYPWIIPDFPSTQSQAEIVSPNFGPAGCRWCVVLTVPADGNGLSGHLQPVLSDEEFLLGEAWTRSIACMTLKVMRKGRAPATASPYGGPTVPQDEVVMNKSLTGGFTFNLTNLSTGWPLLISSEELTEAVSDVDGSVRVECEVTWHADYEREVRRCAKSELITRAGEIRSLRAELETRERSMEDIMAEQSTLAADLEVVKAEYKGAKEKLKGEMEKNEGLKRELAKAREDQQSKGKAEIAVSQAKAKLAEMIAAFEEDGKAFAEKGAENQGEEEGADVQEEKNVRLQARLLAMEAELTQTREQLRLRIAAAGDAALLGESGRPHHSSRRMSIGGGSGADENGDAEKTPIADAIANLRAEIDSARAALDDAATRTPLETDVSPDAPLPTPASEAERAAIRADLAMVHAELEVARAAFVDSAATERPEVISAIHKADLEDIRKEVAIVIDRLERTRSLLKHDTYRFENPSQPIVVPPPSPKRAPATILLPPPPTTAFRSGPPSPQQMGAGYIGSPPMPGSPANPALAASQAREVAALKVQLQEERGRREAIESELIGVRGRLAVAREALLGQDGGGEVGLAGLGHMPVVGYGDIGGSGLRRRKPELWSPVDENGFELPDEDGKGGDAGRLQVRRN
ncbi:hypothetical protein HK101_001961 [Irineochytrium annulatum]|nr:hypothetical protein HK101_001961 [Irineochytrium annulatum]